MKHFLTLLIKNFFCASFAFTLVVLPSPFSKHLKTIKDLEVFNGKDYDQFFNLEVVVPEGFDKLFIDKFKDIKKKDDFLDKYYIPHRTWLS